MLIFGVIAAILYGISLIMLYHNLYSFEKPQKIKFMVMGMLIVIGITILLCYISASGIKMENRECVTIAANASILLFSPIYTMILLPLLASNYNRYHQKQLSNVQMKKRMLIWGLLTILVILVGIGYIKNFQLGLLEEVIKKGIR